VSRAGKDSIDHGPGAYDDVINAAAGAIVAAQSPGYTGGMIKLVVFSKNFFMERIKHAESFSPGCTASRESRTRRGFRGAVKNSI
jgi:hypothetical protein